jgi:hypothetical protein
MAIMLQRGVAKGGISTMKILYILTVLFVFFATAESGLSQEKEIPEGLKGELDKIYDEAVRDANRLKEEILRAYRNPTTKPSKQAATIRVEYNCVRSTGGTFLEDWGVECVRCAWYIIIDKCGKPSDQPGCLPISSRISDYEHKCIYLPNALSPKP